MTIRKLNPTRRQFVAGVSAVSLLGSRAFAQAPPLPSNPDVVIVGAGASGLSAAQRLIHHKRSVVLLEAMPDFGGRAWTDSEFFGVPFDRGCAWIHAADRNPLYPIALEKKFTLHQHDMKLDHVWYGNKIRKFDAREMAEYEKAEKAIIQAAERHSKRGDGSVGSIIRIRTPAEQVAASVIGPMDMAVDLEDLSISHFAGQADLDPNYLVKEGYGNVVKTLGAGLPISLSTPVTRIRYDGPGVVCETPKGDVSARACIISCSVGALNSGRIRFLPALPDWKEDSFNRIAMGLLAKIPMLIEGNERFGLQPFDDLHYERPGRQDIYFLAFPFNENLLIGFVGGKFAWELTAAGKQAAIDFGQESVRRIFGAEAEKKIVKADFTEWGRNPWIRGAYSASLPGHHAARVDLAKPVVNKLFFAGEALAGEFAQTAGGAVLSGRRTADDVNRILG